MVDYNNSNHSTYSRWASEVEIKNSLNKIDINEKAVCGGIPLFYENSGVYVDPTDAHTTIVGGTGSKKTRNIGMPALQLFTRAGESFVATDPKGELYERTLPVLKDQGYNIFILNLRDPQSSNCWNPFMIPYKFYKTGQYDKAIELVTDMSNCMMQDSLSDKEPYWHNSAIDLLLGLIITLFECAKEDQIHLKSLRTLRRQAFKNDLNSDNNTRDYTPTFISEKFLNYLDKSVFIYSMLNGTAEVCDTTRGCIVSVFDQAMRPFFSQNNLVDMLSGNEIDMGTIGKTKTAIFLVMPDENTVYHRLISVFVKQCYTALIFEAQKQQSRKLPVRVNFLLDEFSSLPPISDFPSMITASRSRNIRFHLIIQSLNQLHKRYGYDAETIRGNCENWIFLHSREISLLNELVELSGKKNEEEYLVSVSMLQTLSKEKGEALIFHKRLHPFIANLMDIDQYCPITHNEGHIEYPKNKQQVIDVFDFGKFCKGKDSYFFSQLFDGKKITKEEYYMLNDDDENFEPIFTSRIPSEDDNIKEIVKCIGDI